MKPTISQCVLALLVICATADARAQDRLGSRRHELREAHDALREARGSGACRDRAARVRRAQRTLEAAPASADRTQRRRLQDARERLQDCVYDQSGAAQSRRSGPPRPAPAAVASPLPTIVSRDDGSLLTSGPVLADLRVRAADVRACVAQYPANVRSPFRMTITVQANGRYGSLRVPASASPALVQCMARTVPRWRVAAGAGVGTYRVEVHLTRPRPAAAPSPSRPAPSPAATATRAAPPATTTSPATSRVHLLDARNQRVTSGAVLRDLEQRARAFQTCATTHPGNVPRLFQLTITLNSTGQLVSVRLPAGLDVEFEGCVMRETVAWRVSGAAASDAGLYAATVRLP